MKTMKSVKKAISRKTILKEIASCLVAVEQWKEMESWARCAKYYAQAQVLIELLEVDDCGSVGGFDDARKQDRSRSWSLIERYKWLHSLK